MNVSMAVVGNLPPLLFLTFHNAYGLSYAELGFLVLLNFSTQLIVDLIFSFFPHKFNISATVKLTPLITVLGFLVFTLWPTFFAGSAFVGLIVGTVIFSSSAGLSEVLLNPVIAALPSENPERELSRLHSTYAWGAVGVVTFSTVFILIFGASMWQWLVMLLLIVPVSTFLLYSGAELPHIEVGERSDSSASVLKNGRMWLSVIAIFLGGAIECTMAQWASSFSEVALGIPKIFGDIFGVALFALMLGTGRTLYARYGRNIERVMIAGAVVSAMCYLVAVFSDNAVIGLIACALTGLSASMLWPGNIISATERVGGGVVMYALMAAGGDLGASLGPELVGIVTDAVAANPNILSLATDLGMTAEQLGMKCGLLVGALFALVAIPFYICIFRRKKA